jgi:hypothetical protein
VGLRITTMLDISFRFSILWLRIAIKRFTYKADRMLDGRLYLQDAIELLFNARSYSMYGNSGVAVRSNKLHMLIIFHDN